MNVELLKLHENDEYLNECCSLLNEEWPRSETARMHFLSKSNDKLPISFILIDKQSNCVIAHLRVKKDVLSDAAVIESVVVKRERRGKGYGKYIMNKAEQFIKQIGFTTIKLTTKDKVSFYEKLGYQNISDCKTYVCFGNITILWKQI
ncbi:N-acetyltransferase 6-like protein [Leptotrombidium deliense]|uniref:N-acetyltransferase 6-like protein n=1 Tax=Leptotrombidium deliense TaxID=299467 RepID=A0A443SF47_9ACAR|nr:N-acetyltransferase 6-like protein [Leptotrombidium deliense]